jgi:hypothetical protein
MSDAATALPEVSSAERPLQMLERLAEAGLEIALVLERRVKEAEPAAPLAELTAAAQAFDRVSRAVRLCLLLREELVKERQARAEAGPQDAARKAHRDRALAVVRRVARDHCGHEPFAFSLIAKEAAERLDTDDIYGLVTRRPVGELVALICRDLGLDPDWDVLAEEAWAKAEAASGTPGSPFMRPPPLAGGEAAMAGDPAIGPNARSAGGGVPPRCALEAASFPEESEGPCAHRISPSSAPDG